MNTSACYLPFRSLTFTNRPLRLPHRVGDSDVGAGGAGGGSERLSPEPSTCNPSPLEHLHTHTCAHTCIHTCTQRHAHAYTHVRTCKHAHVCTLIWTPTHVQPHRHMHAHTQRHVHTHGATRAHTNTRAHLQTLKTAWQGRAAPSRVPEQWEHHGGRARLVARWPKSLSTVPSREPRITRNFSRGHGGTPVSVLCGQRQVP